MGSKGQQNLVNQQNVLEVIDDTFTIQKVHRDSQEIPVQGSGERKVLLLGGDLSNVDDLLERDHLDGRNKEKNVDMATEHGEEEPPDHGKRPDCTRDEGLFFLFIFHLLVFWLLLGFVPVHFYISGLYGTAGIRSRVVGG